MIDERIEQLRNHKKKKKINEFIEIAKGGSVLARSSFVSVK